MRASGNDDGTVRWLTQVDRIRPARAERPNRMRPVLFGLGVLAVACVSAAPPGPSASVPDAGAASVPVAVAEALRAPGLMPAPSVPGLRFAIDALPMSFDAMTGIGARELEAAADAGGRDPDEILRFGPVRVRRAIVETVVRAARVTGSDAALLMAIADKESSFAPAVKAKTSSAEGLFQFIDRTWLKVVREYGPTHGLAKESAAIVPDDAGALGIADAAERTRVLALRRDPYLSAIMAAEMLKGDAARLATSIGRTLTNGEIYIAHFLGPDDAERFLGSVVGQPGAVAASLLPRPARANRPIFYASGRKKARGLSVAQVHRKFEEMMGARTSRYQDVLGVPGVMAYAGAPAQ